MDASSCNGCSAAKSDLTIRYDAATRGYTVTQGNRTQTFNPADRDASQSSSALDVYVRRTGNVDENLSLTRPGSSGALTYRYVGAGVWQRATINGNRADFTFDSFTYGMPTTAATLPRTGFASYDVTLIGASGEKGYTTPLALSGAGTLTADLARGDINLAGSLKATDPVTLITAYSRSFSGSAALSSSSNDFAGSFAINNTLMAGSVNGRFYGPAAEEVGATFAVTSAFGDAATGAILGRKGTLQSATGLADLTAQTTFQAPGAFMTYERDPATGQLLARATNGPGSTLATDLSYQRVESLVYDPAAGRYTFTIGLPSAFANRGLDLSGAAFDTSNRVAAKSNARFNVYEKQVGDRALRLTTYQPGTGNDELALTYASFAKLDIASLVGTGRQQVFEAFLPFGVTTPASQMPVVGTASYSGRLYGTAGSAHAFGGNWGGPRPIDFYDLTGAASFVANFANGTLAATLRPIGVNRTDGTSFDFGDIKLSYFFIGGASTLSSATGYQAGAFFGPTANELGVTFRANTRNPAGTDDMVLTGVAVGKRN